MNQQDNLEFSRILVTELSQKLYTLLKMVENQSGVSNPLKENLANIMKTRLFKYIENFTNKN